MSASARWSTCTSSFATCVFTREPFSYTFEEVPDRNHPIHNVLTFHTAPDPVEYSAHIAINGREFPEIVDCGSGPRPSTYVPHTTYLLLEPGEERTVSQDRMSISGTWHRESLTASGALFVRTTTYTITRIE